MSNRAFGVEIECYCPRSIDYDNVVYYLEENGFSEWADLTTTDESLYSGDGIEIKTPPLAGKEGFAEFKRGMDFLKARRFWVDETCGMHVHHDAPEFIDNEDMQRKLIDSWMHNQELIINMVDPSRIDNQYCELWTEVDLQDWVEYGEDHRGAITTNSLYIHGTIEIRLHEGTLNSEEAISWVKFGQSFIDSIADRANPLPPLTDEELLMKRIKVAKNASRFISNKVARNKRR